MDQQTRRDNTTQQLPPEHPRRKADTEDYRVGLSVYNRQPWSSSSWQFDGREEERKGVKPTGLIKPCHLPCDLGKLFNLSASVFSSAKEG